MYETNSPQKIDPSILSYILKLKGRDSASCQLISEAHEFEIGMLAWTDKLEKKRRLDA